MDPAPGISIYKQILLGKLSRAVISTMTFQMILVLTYLFIINFNLTSPLNSLYVLFKPSVYFLLLPYMGVIFFQSVTGAKDYITSDDYKDKKSRFGRFLEIFSLRNVVFLLVHVLMGFSTVWLYVTLSVSSVYAGDYFYLFFGGGFAGFYYAARLYRHEKEKCGLFPVINERKWLRFKGGLTAILSSCKFLAVFPTLHLIWFYPLVSYYFDRPIQGKIFLCVLSYCFNFLIYFNLRVTMFLYDIFLTDPLEFPIVSDCVCLKDAMRFDVPVIVKLACLDFFSLSGGDKRRRAELFSLSQPGGHPHCWNGLIENVLRIINGYTDTLRNSLSDDVHVNKEIKTAETKSYDYSKIRSLVNLTTSPMKDEVKSNFASDCSTVNPAPKSNFAEKIDYLKQKTGYSYLFTETSSEADIKKSLTNEGQIIIWTVLGLASITAASIKEDHYGIVQKDLPVILTSLVELKKSLDKLNRLPAYFGKRDERCCKMKNAVVSAMKRSLFQLCVNFGPYLKDFNLKKEVIAQLQPFVPSLR